MSSDDDDSMQEDVVDLASKSQREITIDAQLLNNHIICSLCNGYLRDAHTIVECLHTFCKICLFNFFQKLEEEHGLEVRYSCPRCHLRLEGTDPFRNRVRFDRTLQNIVDKILPSFCERDEQLKKDLYGPLYKRSVSDVGLGINIPKMLRQSATDSGFTSARKGDEATTHNSAVVDMRNVVDRQKEFGNATMAIELIPDKKDPAASSLEKPLICTSSKVAVKVIKKFLVQKLRLPSSAEVELLCRGELLGNDHSLEFVKKTRWVVAASKSSRLASSEPVQPMQLTFRVR